MNTTLHGYYVYLHSVSWLTLYRISYMTTSSNAPHYIMICYFDCMLHYVDAKRIVMICPIKQHSFRSLMRVYTRYPSPFLFEVVAGCVTSQCIEFQINEMAAAEAGVPKCPKFEQRCERCWRTAEIRSPSSPHTPSVCCATETHNVAPPQTPFR
jgi:hypothetical protein